MKVETMYYWDASAILSAICHDVHSEAARIALQRNAVHVVSSLAWSEVCSVLFRIGRECRLKSEVLQMQCQSLSTGPWRKLAMLPEWNLFSILARKHSLRGADLWHLAMIKTLESDFPSIAMVSFDNKLSEAARAEGLAIL